MGEAGAELGEAPRQRLCAAGLLAERGTAHVFDVLQFGEPARAFALRFEGRVVAYLNRCVHVPTELDWQPGEFLDAPREAIVCAIHGASYEPRNGRCIGGPCGRGRLLALDVREEGGEVYWYPSSQTRPLPAEPAVAPTGAPPPPAPSPGTTG